MFSNGSIGNVMPVLEGKFPEIARAAGIVAIVSRWELPHTASGVVVGEVTRR